MDFALTEEQELLQHSVERLLRRSLSTSNARKRYAQEPGGYSRALWDRYAELGLLGLPFAEEHGGSAGGPVETMIVMEAGRPRARARALSRDRRARRRAAAARRRQGAARRSRAEDRRRRSHARLRPRRAAVALRSRRRRGERAARRRAATCSTAPRAWCCTATAPESSSSRRGFPAAQTRPRRLGAVLGRCRGARRVDARLCHGRRLRAAEVTLSRRARRCRRRASASPARPSR